MKTVSVGITEFVCKSIEVTVHQHESKSTKDTTTTL